MQKFMIDENPSAKGIHYVHNATQAIACLADTSEQMLIGYFANEQLAYKRARMNWPRAKIELCDKCHVTTQL